MRILAQRVTEASVSVDGRQVAAIGGTAPGDAARRAVGVEGVGLGRPAGVVDVV